MFKPALVEPQQIALGVLVIHLYLTADQFLSEVVVIGCLVAYSDLLNIVEYSFKFVKADVVAMVSAMPL